MIDIRTFILVLAVGNFGFAILMAGYARSGAPNRAIDLWKWSKLLQGIGHMGDWFCSGQSWPAVASLANVVLLSGIALEVAAYTALFGLGRYRSWLYAGTALAATSVVLIQMAGAPLYLVGAVMSLAIAALSAAMGVILLRAGARTSLLQRIIGANDALFCVAMLVRAGAALADPVLAPHASSYGQTFAYLAGYLLTIVNGFGFLLLCKERDDRKMKRLATIDSLTGLVNRRAFFDLAARARQFAGRVHKPVALMMLDIDHFKALNDRFGHACGDAALCVFAATAEATLREHDILGRMGGEEFALVMPGTDLEGACYAAERLRAAVAATEIDNDGQPYAMTVSIGVTLVGPDEHINAALARADHALYQAKSAGRNRIEVGNELQKAA